MGHIEKIRRVLLIIATMLFVVSLYMPALEIGNGRGTYHATYGFMVPLIAINSLIYIVANAGLGVLYNTVFLGNIFHSVGEFVGMPAFIIGPFLSLLVIFAYITNAQNPISLRIQWLFLYGMIALGAFLATGQFTQHNPLIGAYIWYLSLWIFYLSLDLEKAVSKFFAVKVAVFIFFTVLICMKLFSGHTLNMKALFQGENVKIEQKAPTPDAEEQEEK